MIIEEELTMKELLKSKQRLKKLIKNSTIFNI